MLMRKLYIILSACLFAGQVCAQEPLPKYCLENDITHAYMTDFSYDTIPDYNVSYIMDYFNMSHDYRLDAPKPVNLSWTAGADAESQRIEVSESSAYTDALVFNVSKDKNSYDVYNLIPGKTYYYRVMAVKADGATEIASGSFETTGSLRMLLAEGTWNVRDMGGWISSLTGQPIAYGKIYRGAQLIAPKDPFNVLVTEAGIKALRDAGIRAELDLRSSSQAPSSVSAIAVKDADGRYDVDFKLISESVNARMLNFDNNDANIRELKWVISELKQNKPVYFHCQNGADRTGTLGFLIGALLGMSEGDLAKDYELTTFCEEAAAAFDPTEAGFARLRNYEGKKGSPLGSGDNADEYMFAKLADKMKSVEPVNGTYQEKIYNFFLNGVGGNKVSPADLSWFIKEMTGFSVLGGMETDVDTLNIESGSTHKLVVKPMPEDAEYKKISFESSNQYIATVSDDGVVTAVGGGSALITVHVDGISKVIPVYVPISEDNIPHLCLENDLVHSFLSEVKYDDADYSVSLIEKYDTVAVSYARDCPIMAGIKWVPGPGTVKQSLLISDKADFSTSINDETFGGSVNSFFAKDLDPQKIFYYSVYSVDQDGKSLMTTSSAFLTTGTVKMIRADGTYNVRDFGGWTGLDGRKVKYGKLVRGARLKNNKDAGGKVIVASEGLDVLNKKMGLNAELDLRSDEETDNSKSALSARSAKYLRIADANTCLGDKVLEGDAYIQALNQIIEWLKADRKIYVSSSLGADRVGALAFLINGLLGVDEESLSKDYELSSFSEDVLEDVIRKRTDSQYVGMVNKIKTLEGETLQKKIYNYFKTGVNGTAVSAEDLDWFINEMLDKESSPLTGVSIVEQDRTLRNGRIYNLLGQEVKNPGKGIYIMNGKKYIVR